MPKESSIKHYSSSTTGSIPAAGDLLAAEIAINTTDEKVFFKNTAGSVVSLSQTKDLSGAFAAKNQTVASFNGATGTVTYAPPLATTTATGAASFSATNFNVAAGAVSIKSGGVPNAALANSSFTLRDEIGGTDTISLGDTLTITGGRGIDFLRTTTDTYQVSGITATSSVLGVASFNTASFTVSSGDVTIKSGGVSNSQLVNSSVTVSAGTGLGGGGSVALGSSTTLTNLGVVSLNGLTGAVTMTGDGGALVGVGNNTIAARIASTGVTGVALFSSLDFTVGSGGSVSLTGNVARTNIANTFTTGLQRFNAGISAAGVTANFLSLSGTGSREIRSTNGDMYLMSTTGGIGTSTVGQITLPHSTAVTIYSPTNKLALQSGVLDPIGTYNTGLDFYTAPDTFNAWITTLQPSASVSANRTITLPNDSGIVALTKGTVASINGLTGTVSITNGSNVTITQAGNTITIASSGGGGGSSPIATASLTGVASFPTTDFGVSTAGAVSLTGNVARTNIANTFTALQSFSTGLSASNGITFGSNVTINGNLNATTKSFVIPHPSKPGMTLRYGSLEGPENGVYVRGKLQGSNVIELPKYWADLVEEDSITVNLTSVGSVNPHHVVSSSATSVVVGSMSGEINCHYMVLGERKDVPKLEVEY